MTTSTPILAPGGVFHLGDVVVNRNGGDPQIVTKRGTWEAGYYRIVTCPHGFASPIVLPKPELDWQSIAARVALDDGGFARLSTAERDALEAAMDAVS